MTIILVQPKNRMICGICEDDIPSSTEARKWIGYNGVAHMNCFEKIRRAHTKLWQIIGCMEYEYQKKVKVYQKVVLTTRMEFKKSIIQILIKDCQGSEEKLSEIFRNSVNFVGQDLNHEAKKKVVSDTCYSIQ